MGTGKPIDPKQPDAGSTEKLNQTQRTARVGVGFASAISRAASKALLEFSSNVDHQEVASTRGPKNIALSLTKGYATFFQDLANSSRDIAEAYRSTSGRALAKRTPITPHKKTVGAPSRTKPKNHDVTFQVGRYTTTDNDLGEHTFVLSERRGRTTLDYPWFKIVSAARSPSSVHHTRVARFGHGEYRPTSTHDQLWTPGRWEAHADHGILPTDHHSLRSETLGRTATADGRLKHVIQTTPHPGIRWCTGLEDRVSGHSSGIVYGVTGLTHQIANRILWSATAHDTAGNAIKHPIAWPPGSQRSVDPSTWIYGLYGTDWDVWRSIYLEWEKEFAQRDEMHIRLSATPKLDEQFGVAQKPSRAEDGIANPKLYSRETRFEAIALLIASRLPDDIVDAAIDETVEVDCRFHESKLELDRHLLLGEVTSGEYGETLTELVEVFAKEVYEVLKPHYFRKLFGVSVPQDFRLPMDPNLLPGKPPNRA